MRKIRMALKVVIVFSIILLSACKEEENVGPTVRITSPREDATLLKGEIIPIKAMADDEDGSIAELSIYIEGDRKATSESSTLIYNWDTEDYEVGEYVLNALAADDDGTSQVVNMTVLLDAAGGLNPDLSYGSMNDIEGNSYATIELGDQVWMAENLKASQYSDGTPITEISDEAEWKAMNIDAQAYCWYNNLSEYSDSTGALYTWAAVMNGGLSSAAVPSGIQGVCPDGWHLPSDGEWKLLEMHLGMSQADADNYDWRGSDEGGQLKEQGFTKWQIPNTGASNSSGFTAVPGGFRSALGAFYGMDQNAAFWTATQEEGEDDAWVRIINFDNDRVYRHYNDMRLGLSVRCVQNAAR